MVVHCLFEQSGIFRDAFRKFGYVAYDYDIANQFGKTDHQIDLFNEIRKASQKENSIFDSFTEEDLLLVFFPCIRFSALVMTVFNDRSKVTVKDRIEHAKRLNKEQSELFQLICDLFLIVDERHLKMIVENPHTQPHFLTQYFPIKPKLIDRDRRLLGDRFKKPTQYWFVNIEPKNNSLHRPFEFGKKVNRVNVQDVYTVDNVSRDIGRSLVEPKYAENFIKKHIL